MNAKRGKLNFDMDIAPVEPPAALRPAARVRQEPKEERQHLSARVPVPTYRKLKARAAIRGEKVQDLVEQAIDEFLTNHPD